MKRAITFAEHDGIVEQELNTKRRDFYELLWHTGAAQSDVTCLGGGGARRVMDDG